jgi:hypothetical protein
VSVKPNGVRPTDAPCESRALAGEVVGTRYTTLAIIASGFAADVAKTTSASRDVTPKASERP